MGECFGDTASTTFHQPHSWAVVPVGPLMVIVCTRCHVAREVCTWDDWRAKAEVARQVEKLSIVLDDVRTRHGVDEAGRG